MKPVLAMFLSVSSVHFPFTLSVTPLSQCLFFSPMPADQFQDHREKRNVVKCIDYGEKQFSPMGSECGNQDRSEVVFHQYHRDQADQTDQDTSPPLPQGLEPDPGFFHKAGNDKSHHFPYIAISVIHHLLRIHEQLPLRVQGHGIRLDRDIQKR